MFYVYTHLGLGDIILCNGLIRNICKKYDNVSIFCKPHYMSSVTYMFRDLNNLTIISADDHRANDILSTVPDEQQYRVGHENISSLIHTFTFDECFYRQTGLNFAKRWTDFYIERDLTKENELYERLAPKKPYAFIHDDSSRGFTIDQTYVNKNLVIFRPEKIDNIFLYCSIIEKAHEIHCMDSSFKHIVDSLTLTHKNLFYHIYVRGCGNTAYAQSKLNWKKIL